MKKEEGNIRLIVDVGNTNIVCAIFVGDIVKVSTRIETKVDLPVQYYLSSLNDLFLETGIDPSKVCKIIISSVVSEKNSTLEESVLQYFGEKAKIIGPEDFITLPFEVPKPYEIGSDLVSNAYAIFTEVKEDCLIVDFGTALTFTLYHHDVGMVGVTISPGIGTSIHALSGNTSRLPEVDISVPESVIGKNTTHAIQAGVLYGYIGLIKELVARIKIESGRDLKVIATGGLSKVLPDLDNIIDRYDDSLTLRGISYFG